MKVSENIMVNKDLKKVYCTIEHNFPENALLLFLLIHDHKKLKILYPIGPIYNSIHDILADSRYFGNLTSGEDGLSLSEEALILPIKMEKLYPLEKRFWLTPQVNYSHLDRLELFSRVVSNHSFFKLIVTPLTYGKKTLFMSAFPYYSTADDKIVETFMLTSNFPVDQKAKFAAIYNFETGVHLNWRTGIISELPFSQIEKKFN